MNWEALYPYVLPQTPGCPDPVLDHHIKNAVIDFCRRTLCYTYHSDPLIADGESHTFDLDMPSQTSLVKLQGVSVGGRDWPIVTPIDGRRMLRQQYNIGRDFCFTPDGLTLYVHDLPRRHHEIITDLAVTPTHKAHSIANGVIEDYLNDIAFGALASLMAMQGNGVVWANPKLAMANAAMFSERIGVVAMKIARGRGSAKMRNFTTYC